MTDRLLVPPTQRPLERPTLQQVLQRAVNALDVLDLELKAIDRLPAQSADVMRLKHAHEENRRRVLAVIARLYAKAAPQMLVHAETLAPALEALAAAALGEPEVKS